ncbi:MAG: type I methionyl aminopeptidase [Chloroflexi bacterium]|nr:type I methionyl aminopeptidase [Chloroflexota bacterium]
MRLINRTAEAQERGRTVVAGIPIKSPRELEYMRQAGQVVAAVLGLLERSVEPGMRTRDLDTLVRQEIRRLGAKPAFLGYKGFPATICVSINNEIVHGIPGDRVVRKGDLVSLDAGAIVSGFYADGAITVGVGSIGREERALIDVTREALERAVALCRDGVRIGDLGHAVQSLAEGRGYSVVREYVGHGVGRALHEEPSIPNFGTPGMGVTLRKGMVIAIEPMVNLGGWRTALMDDDWTVVTADGSLSAHFEHTVAIGEDGAEVLTRLNGEGR